MGSTRPEDQKQEQSDNFQVEKQQIFKIIEDKLSSQYLEMLIKDVKSHPDVINAKNKQGMTPLMMAVMRQDRTITNMLLLAGADPNIKDNNDSTALFFIQDDYSVYILEDLLKAKANINAQNNAGKTYLHYVAAENSREKEKRMEYLLTHGADRNIRDNEGCTALICAIKHDDYMDYSYGHRVNKNVTILTNKDNINIKDNQGRTALHWAIDKRRETVAHFLLSAGANKSLKDNNGKTPYDLTSWRWSSGFRELLRPSQPHRLFSKSELSVEYSDNQSLLPSGPKI